MIIENMKKIIILFLFICLFGCHTKEDDFLIYVISDTHYISDSLVDPNNKIYTKEYLTPDCRNQKDEDILIDSLINEINDNDVDLVVFTGDLSYHGSLISLKEFKNKINKINTQVLVIPGNHDLYIQNTYSFINDMSYKVENVDNESFKELFKDNGYDSLYQDKDSLSYAYIANEKIMCLMLDTTKCRYNDSNNQNLGGGYLSDRTLVWVEEMLKYAKENELKVISFTHHNLLVHNELFKNGYVIDNVDKLVSLYKKYDVKLNMSGHMHLQHIKQEDGIVDIANGSYLMYGNRYGILNISDNQIEYNSKQIKIDGIDIQNNSLSYFTNSDFFEDENVGLLMAHYFDGDYEYIKNNYKKENINNYSVNILFNSLENNNQHFIVIEY